MAARSEGATTVAEALRSPQAERRVAAMAGLAARALPPEPAELEAIVDCLRDGRSLVQRHAAESLACLERRGIGVEGPIRRLLASAEPRARWGAVYALFLIGTLGPEGIETLVESLGSDDRDLRWAAVEVLKKLALGHRAAVVERATEVGCGGTLVQRRMAFYLMRDLEASDDAAVAATLQALDARDSNLRLAALAALTASRPNSMEVARRVATLVPDTDLRVARAAAAALGRLDRCPADVMDSLRRACRSTDASLRRAAQSSLARLERRED